MPRKSQKPEPPKDSWAHYLRGWRRFNGLTQAQAAEVLKVPFRTYQNWEHGNALLTILPPSMLRRLFEGGPK